jgi:hypothetical protein
VDPLDVVNAIADDLSSLAQAVDDTYLDWRHVRPDLLDATSAPWLAVWAPQTTHTLVATPDEYMDELEVTVEWAVSIADEADTISAGAADIVSQAMADIEPIWDRMRTYASGVPGLDNQTVATMATTTRDATVGLVWRQTVRLNVSVV